MIVDQRFDDSTDQFPVGMRVLAVDDNPICLRLLDSLLRKCQYHVTTTNEAMTALNLLRDNRNHFDLVISDVHMPDMDGFKLLELVGLEMDLPVIMLSANGDTKLVMKGITHGACDYLLKPVRIEELKNIWQHVIRRKKNDPKDQLVNNNHDKNQLEVIDPNGFFDHNVKQNRKRKDQEGEDDDDNNDDGANQKKPRVVWTVELHRKFVSAVNHLGIDKAVPKKILDLMNVEKLTRENVASHLQKYRLYLKRISCVASHQANMVAALSGVDSGLLRMDAFGNGFQNAHFRSPAGVMLSRLNTPAALGIHGLPSGLVQFGHELNMNNPNHVKIGDLVNPSSSNFSEKNAPIRLPIGHPLDIHKGILGISASTTQSDIQGCYENWQGQIQHSGAEPIGYDAGVNVNGSVMQGWDGNGQIDMSRQSNLSCSSSIDSSMIQGMAMMGPFSPRMETTSSTTNGLVTYNSNNEFSSVNPSFFNDSLSGKQRFLMDQERKPQNGIFYANNNVGSLEDLIGPVMNQGKSF